MARSYTPANADGTATIGSPGRGGDRERGTTRHPTFTIDPRVNDPPSFTKGADVSVERTRGEDGHRLATDISKGASNEGSTS
jgi:hypothetical protein